MNRFRLAVLIVCCSGVAAGFASWAALKVHQDRNDPHEHGAAAEGDFHQWVHGQLDLRPEQEKTLLPIEAGFQKERSKLEKSLASAGHDLAHAIQDHGRGSPELAAALGRINQLQLELQQLTLNHFFDMEAHLDPDQARKLLEWTHDSISEAH